MADSLKVSASSILFDDTGELAYTPVSSFEDGNCYDLMDSHNNAYDIPNGQKLYLHYMTDKDAFARFGETPKSTHNTASVFSNWDVIAECGASLLVGLGGGIGISYFADKRKKKKTNNA